MENSTLFIHVEKQIIETTEPYYDYIKDVSEKNKYEKF